MAKNKVSEWSSTASNNTDIGGVNIAEGCAPSGINNAIRELMAQLKDQQDGADGDNFTAGGNLSVTGSADINSTSALKLPVGTTAQRPTGANGKVRYNSTTSAYEGYNGSTWSSLGGGATGAGGDTVFNLNSLEVTTSYTLPTGKSAMSVGAITINSGVTVTIPSGQRWVIL